MAEDDATGKRGNAFPFEFKAPKVELPKVDLPISDDVKKTIKDATDNVRGVAVDVADNAAENVAVARGAVAKAGYAVVGGVSLAGEAVAKSVDNLKEGVGNKAPEIDMYEQAIIDYNAAYTELEDRGVELYRQRERSADVIAFVERLVNSIANHPKSFDSDFEEVDFHRKSFVDSAELARKGLEAAKLSAADAGAGFAAGAAVASLAPNAALWVATTFGTASTGAAISTLSGAAATKAALAWLGGGALAAGGGGIAAGNALLALAGPVGWGIAGATLLTSIALFAHGKMKCSEEREQELASVKRNTELVAETSARVAVLLDKTMRLRESLVSTFSDSMGLYGADFSSLSDEDQFRLGALVNNTKSLCALLSETIDVNVATDGAPELEDGRE